MNLATLETLAKAIKSKGQLVTPETLAIESLFHKGGTLSEEQANELLWQKCNQIESDMRKEGYKDNSFICPLSLEFNVWCGESTPWN